MFSLFVFFTWFSFLLQLDEGGGKDHISSLDPSLLPLCFFFSLLLLLFGQRFLQSTSPLLRFYPSSCTIYPIQICNFSVLASLLCHLPRRSRSLSSSPCWWLILLQFSQYQFFESQIYVSTICHTRALPPHSPTSPLPGDTGRSFFHCPRTSTWLIGTGPIVLCTASCWICLFSSFFLVYLLLYFYVAWVIVSFQKRLLYLNLCWYFSLMVLLPFQPPFGWLLLIPSRYIDRLVLFYTSLNYKTALCDPLKRQSFISLISYFLYIFQNCFDFFQVYY